LLNYETVQGLDTCYQIALLEGILTYDLIVLTPQLLYKAIW